MNLLEAIRARGAATSRALVFTSSIAVFGAPFPEKIPDEFFSTPLTSYGTQKAIGELLLADYTRKGMLDGVGIRLPTICVRPGTPNKAASGFFSNIIREPLAGARGGAAGLRGRACTGTRARAPRSASCCMPRPSTATSSAPAATCRCRASPVTVGEQIEALRKVAGDKVVARIRREPDPFIAGHRRRLAAQLRRQARAVELGFKADASFEEIIRIHIEDELEGKIA